MHTAEFLVLLEGIVRSAVAGNYPIDWNEDFITRSLLKALRSDLGHVHLSDQPEGLEIRWRAWKQVGRAEHTFGDVAVLVRLRARGLRRPLDGVGFLEAKRRYPSGTFDELRPGQMTRIAALAPHAGLLLYDFSPVSLSPILPGPLPVWWASWQRRSLPVPLRQTYAITVPIQVAMATGIRDAGLYRFGLPFSQQMVGRYFCGLDLEFSEKALATARGQTPELGAPRYLVVAAVGRGVAPEEVEVNTNVFTDLAAEEEAG